MGYLTRQIAAWKDSWARLSGADEAVQRQFLRRVGERLGECAPERAVQRARLVLGLDEMHRR